MTKAKTQGGKRRNKRGRPRNGDAPRTPSGQISRAGKYQPSAERQEAVQRVALAARARHTGNPEERAMLDAMKAPWMGCNAGRAISGQPDAPALWEHILKLRAIRAAYLIALDAPSDYAKTARLPVKPGDGDTGVDASRSRGEPLPDDEAAALAIRRWDAVTDALRVVSPLLVRLIDRVVIHDDPAPEGFPAALRLAAAAM